VRKRWGKLSNVDPSEVSGGRPGLALGWYNFALNVRVQSGDRGNPPTAANGGPIKLVRTLARIINIVIILAAIRDPVHELAR
jgi:hypothetical protein